LESLMTAAATEDLRLVNRRLSDLLARTCGAEDDPGGITPQDLGDVLSDLLLAAACVRVASSTPGDLELASEVATYRTCLQRLRDALPKIQMRLLTEKARLEAERAHLQAASAWAETSTKTF
jgi:hypothetical protein